MKDAFDVTHEICELIKLSPRREAMFDKQKSHRAPGTPRIRALCPTRWTVRAQSLKSIIDNYEVLLDLWDDCLDVVKQAELRSRIIGVQAQMSNFGFYWGINLGELLLRHVDNLSKTLQNPKLSAASGQEKIFAAYSKRKRLQFVLLMVPEHKEHLGDFGGSTKTTKKTECSKTFSNWSYTSRASCLHKRSTPNGIIFWHWIIL